MVTHRLIALSVLAAVTIQADTTLAQGTFPAPLPGQSAVPGVGPPAAPPLIAPASDCIKEFYPLRQDAETKGKLIKAAGERHAAPEEACKLITSYSAAEIKMIDYVEANAQCGIPAQVADQLRAGHKTTEALQRRICAAAEQSQHRGPRLPVGDFPDSHGRY